METTLNTRSGPSADVAEAQAVAREFLAAALPDVQRVDITKVAPVTSGEATWEAEAEVWQPNATLKSAGHRDRAARAGSQPLPGPARRPAERAGIRTGRDHPREMIAQHFLSAMNRHSFMEGAIVSTASAVEAGLYLYGIIDAEDGLAVSLPGIDGGEVETIEADGVAAVVTPGRARARSAPSGPTWRPTTSSCTSWSSVRP